LGFGIPILTYLSSDEEWLSGFFEKTLLSTAEIRALIREMPAVLRSEKPCRNRSASLAVAVYRDLNVEYLHKMFGSVNVSGNVLMSVWSLKVFHNRNYFRFMTDVVEALRESYSTGQPIVPLEGKIAENLVLHNESQLGFPVAATKGIYEHPTAGDITAAFTAVKNGISKGPDVDAVSKQLVVQAVEYDIASLKYMFKIEGVGPVLERLGSRVFRLYEETLGIVSML
jgi:hypothetical protein